MLRILPRFPATFILIVDSISLLYIYLSHTLPFTRLCHRLLSSSQAQYQTLYQFLLSLWQHNLHYLHIASHGNIVTVTFHSSVYTFFGLLASQICLCTR